MLTSLVRKTSGLLFQTVTCLKKEYWHKFATMTSTLSVLFQCSTIAVVSPSFSSATVSIAPSSCFHKRSCPGNANAPILVDGCLKSRRTANGSLPPPILMFW